MYPMSADESGDCGMPVNGSPTRYFCLSGVVVHELRWLDTIQELMRFRRWMNGRYHVFLEAEIHASEMISKPSRLDPSLQALRKHEQLAILRQFADVIATISDISIINIIVDKRGKVASKDEVFRKHRSVRLHAEVWRERLFPAIAPCALRSRIEQAPSRHCSALNGFGSEQKKMGETLLGASPGGSYCSKSPESQIRVYYATLFLRNNPKVYSAAIARIGWSQSFHS